MSKLPAKIQNVQNELSKLSELKNFEQTQRVILSVIKLLDDTISEDNLNLFQLFNDSDGKIRANATWFYEDPVIADRKATYKVHADNKLNLDFKVYGVNKAKKQIISWATALTPNFEDEPFNSKFNIGIDFIIPRGTDRVIIVLTNNYVIRTLELKGDITVTYQEILAKWTEIKDFTNKSAVHTALWESFDLQPLNKKFYAGISERFIILRQHLIKEEIFDEKHSSMFANRLIGRVIFTWFLDKKGIINPTLKYFDSQSFESDNEYYKTKLERLFFGVLNTPVEEREYKDEVTPFLNGGLFEARANDLYKDNKLSFPKNYFDDLFDFLSAYNFTTDESTSQFQQVAIDPEMLGRIFENLLAEITEETGEQARKAKGAFYTPREIVDYMCKESLREYLKTKLTEDTYRDQRLFQLIDASDRDFQDQDHNWRRDWKPYKDAILSALDDLKVLDPACGSGAFPIGMLQLLVRVYERLEPRFDGYKAKLQIIERNIYGVDIEPMAVEIARLRTWLSIIVDEESDSRKIKPLPNLEFKFVCANSLIGLNKNEQVELYGDDVGLEGNLRDLRDAYFNTESLNKKKKLRNDYDQLINKGSGLWGESVKSKQLKTYIPFDNESVASFFDPDFMFGIKTFSIIIANPPYIGNRGNEKIFQAVTNSDLGKRFYTRWMDYFYFFFHFALDKTDEDSQIAFITTNYYVTATGGTKLRQDIKDRANIKRLINFNEFKIFESALGQHNMITILSKKKKGKDVDECISKNSITSKKGIAKLNDLQMILNGEDKETSYYDIEQSDLYDGDDLQIRIGGIKKNINNKYDVNEVFSKMKDTSVPLESITKITTGIVTLSDTFSDSHLRKFPDIKSKKGEGIYVLTQEELENINLPNEEIKKYIKPFFKNSDIKKYYSKTKNELWLIYIKDEGIPIKLSSALIKHFERFKDLIVALKSNFLKNKIASSIVKKWFNNGNYFVLFTPKKTEYFDGPKIVAPYRSKSNTFAYNETPWFSSKDVAFILPTDKSFSIKYILAILNSSLVYKWLYFRGKRKGETLELYQKPLSDIPIKIISEEAQEPFITLVDKILEINNNNSSESTREIEDQIDELVLNLYGLTEEEKEIVRLNIK